MAENEAVLAGAQGAEEDISPATGVELLRAMRARLVATMGEKSPTVKGIDKDISKLEKGLASSTYVAPAVAYDAEKVMDRITTVQADNEQLLSEGGTVIVKITGGDVRQMSLLPNQVRHLSGNGMRRITQESPSGRNDAPRCVNIQDTHDGKFHLSAGNEMKFEEHRSKAWK